MKKISIIVPMYNAKESVIRCLKSIYIQKYDNYEVIIVNDGSTDNCNLMVEEYIKDKKRFSLLSIENSGVSHARNIGIENATGEYITFMDADDYLEDIALENIMSILNTSDIDCLKFGYYKKLGKIVKKYNFNCKCDSILAKKDYKTSVFPKILLNNDFSSVWNLVVKSSIIKKIKFDETKKYAEDRKFNFDVLSNSNNVYICSEPLYYYVINNKSVMNNVHSEKAIKQIIDVIDTNKYIYNNCKCIDIKKDFEKSICNDLNNLILNNYANLSYKEYISRINEASSNIISSIDEKSIINYIRDLFEDNKKYNKYLEFKSKLFIHFLKNKVKMVIG